MNGFEKRAEKKKQDILEASEKLIIKNGPSETSVKAIADLAGVSPVTIFKFFDTKDNLVEITLIRRFEQHMSELEKIVSSDDDFLDKLKKALLYKSKLSKQLNEEIYTLYVGYLEQGNENFVKFLRINKELTNQIFAQGKKEGIINENISDEALALYMNLINQSIATKENIVKVTPMIDDIMNLICFGFAGK